MRILYATDGSEGARSAGLFLTRLPLDSGARIHIVTVQDAGDRYGDDLLDATRASLEKLPLTTSAEALTGSTTGAIVSAILQAADTNHVDLIVVGACGCSAITRFFMGSVAEGVARHARCSVLVVRPGTARPLESVTVGVDGSPGSRDALLWLTSTFPLPPTCALHLVAVVPSQTWATFIAPSEVSPSNPALAREIIRVQSIADERFRAETLVISLARELRHTPFGEDTARRRIETEVVGGLPTAELTRAAAAHGADLIVVGAHGQTAIHRFLIGSVSERVLRHAPCSVLVVKPRVPLPAG